MRYIAIGPPTMAEIPELCHMTQDEGAFNPFNNLETDDFYKTEEGYLVFTAKYLLKRGYCCQNGCRHCPYGFDRKKGRFVK